MQSVFKTHSGLHPVEGSPWYSGKQVQEPTPFFSLHTALEPQGDGLQGSMYSVVAKRNVSVLIVFF